MKRKDLQKGGSTMGLEKRNVVEERRTPKAELHRSDEDWDKQAAAAFDKYRDNQELDSTRLPVVKPDEAKTPAKE